MERTHKVKFFYPGTLMAETSVSEIPSRDPEDVDVPERAFAFVIYDVVEQEATLEDGRTTVHRETENETGRFYPDADVFTPDQIPDLDKYRILRSNAKHNGWDRLVRTRAGNWQPLQDEDTVL